MEEGFIRLHRLTIVYFVAYCTAVYYSGINLEMRKKAPVFVSNNISFIFRNNQ